MIVGVRRSGASLLFPPAVTGVFPFPQHDVMEPGP